MLCSTLAASGLYPHLGSWTVFLQDSCTQSANTFCKLTQLLCISLLFLKIMPQSQRNTQMHLSEKEFKMTQSQLEREPPMVSRSHPKASIREDQGLCAHWEGFSRVRLWDQSHKSHLSILSEVVMKSTLALRVRNSRHKTEFASSGTIITCPSS